jgi:hypothetical protein
LLPEASLMGQAPEIRGEGRVMKPAISIVVPSYNEAPEFVNPEARAVVSVLRVQWPTPVSIRYL